MKRIGTFLLESMVAGLLVVVPAYLAVLLLLKATKSVLGLVRPFAKMLPDSVPAENLLAMLLVLVVCMLIGLLLRTWAGRVARERIERTLTDRLPGYALFRSLTNRIAGESRENEWMPALVEIEEALVPGFIIEELEDGRYTVFVPSIPTPLAGAVYILDRKRVHPLNVPFTQAIQAVSRWGAGSKELVAAMEQTARPG